MKRALVFAAIMVAALAVHSKLSAEPSADQKETLALLELGVKEHPQNADIWVHLAFEYRKLNNVDKAQNAFEQATTLDPKQAEGFYMLGLIYEKKNLNSQAKQAWKSCLAATADEGMKQTALKHLHVLETSKH